MLSTQNVCQQNCSYLLSGSLKLDSELSSNYLKKKAKSLTGEDFRAAVFNQDVLVRIGQVMLR